MLLTEYDEKELRELFLAEGKLLDLAGLVHDGDLSMTVAENRAWQKYGVPKEVFRKMVEEYDPKVEEYDPKEEMTRVPAKTSKKGRA